MNSCLTIDPTQPQSAAVDWDALNQEAEELLQTMGKIKNRLPLRRGSKQRHKLTDAHTQKVLAVLPVLSQRVGGYTDAKKLAFALFKNTPVVQRPTLAKNILGALATGEHADALMLLVSTEILFSQFSKRVPPYKGIAYPADKEKVCVALSLSRALDEMGASNDTQLQFAQAGRSVMTHQDWVYCDRVKDTPDLAAQLEAEGL